MELGTPSLEKQGLNHPPQVEQQEYSTDKLAEIGNEMQMCVVCLEKSDLTSWVTSDSQGMSDSERFRIWLASDKGVSALKTYLGAYSLERIHSRWESIYSDQKNLLSLVDDDPFLPAFVADFRKAYPRPTANDTEIPSGETIH